MLKRWCFIVAFLVLQENAIKGYNLSTNDAVEGSIEHKEIKKNWREEEVTESGCMHVYAFRWMHEHGCHSISCLTQDNLHEPRKTLGKLLEEWETFWMCYMAFPSLTISYVQVRGRMLEWRKKKQWLNYWNEKDMTKVKINHCMV